MFVVSELHFFQFVFYVGIIFSDLFLIILYHELLAGKQLVDDHPKCPHVNFAAERLFVDYLGRLVVECAAVHCTDLPICQSPLAECPVDYLNFDVLFREIADQNVAEFEVSMDYSYLRVEIVPILEESRVILNDFSI